MSNPEEEEEEVEQVMFFTVTRGLQLIIDMSIIHMYNIFEAVDELFKYFYLCHSFHTLFTIVIIAGNSNNQ